MNSTLSLGLQPKVQAPIRGDLPGPGSTSQTPGQFAGKLQHDPALQTVLPLQSGHANPMGQFLFSSQEGAGPPFSTTIVSAHYTEGEVIEGQKLLKTSEIICDHTVGHKNTENPFLLYLLPKNLVHLQSN